MQNLLRSQRGKWLDYFAIFFFLSITSKAIIEQQLNTKRNTHNPSTIHFPQMSLTTLENGEKIRWMCYNLNIRRSNKEVFTWRNQFHWFHLLSVSLSLWHLRLSPSRQRFFTSAIAVAVTEYTPVMPWIAKTGNSPAADATAQDKQ